MLQWTCRHLHHMLFMVMQDMHPLEEWPDPCPDSSLVGTSTFRSQRPEDHHGKMQVSNEWDQAACANWGSSSSSGGAPPLFAARCSFSA